MAQNGKFKPAKSGNPDTRFKPGNRHRWQPGQSGNPSGISRRRLEFEEAFYTALLDQGAATEAAELLWNCARARDPWAIQALLQRLAPETQHIQLSQEKDSETAIDYTRLNDAEIEQLATLLGRATASDAPATGGTSETQSEAVCDASVADSGTADGVR